MSVRLPLFCLAVALALPGCSPIVRTHGMMVDEEILRQLQPGISREADVVALLGTPTAESTFDPRREWYYVGQRTEQTAFMAPEVTKREVIRVRFDDNGTVAGVEKLDKAAGLDITPIARSTPTVGHNLTVMEQVLGNIGRFSPPDKK